MAVAAAAGTDSQVGAAGHSLEVRLALFAGKARVAHGAPAEGRMSGADSSSSYNYQLPLPSGESGQGVSSKARPCSGYFRTALGGSRIAPERSR